MALVMGIKVLVRRESRRWAGEGSPSRGMLRRLRSAAYTSVPSHAHFSNRYLAECIALSASPFD